METLPERVGEVNPAEGRGRREDHDVTGPQAVHGLAVAVEADEAPVLRDVDAIGEAARQGAVARRHPILEDVRHGHELRRAALDHQRVPRRAAPAPTAADHRDPDLLLAADGRPRDRTPGEERGRREATAVSENVSTGQIGGLSHDLMRWRGGVAARTSGQRLTLTRMRRTGPGPCSPDGRHNRLFTRSAFDRGHREREGAEPGRTRTVSTHVNHRAVSENTRTGGDRFDVACAARIGGQHGPARTVVNDLDVGRRERRDRGLGAAPTSVVACMRRAGASASAAPTSDDSNCHPRVLPSFHAPCPPARRGRRMRVARGAHALGRWAWRWAR